ncbi:MAG: hypothetical protein KGH55_00520 [Nanoarchaeota archaeon]|nr:hypothetical protein [Nanoarchaeota archaeon]
MSDFLFHRLSEKDKEQVREKAKMLLASFSEKISKVKISDEEPLILRKNFEREEKEGDNCDLLFKDIMFENAPDKNKDFIIAEKRSWN